MPQTTSIECQCNFGEFQRQARYEPVEIAPDGRRELVLLSADHYDWLIAAARRTFRTSDSMPVVTDAVHRVEIDAERARIDDLNEVSTHVSPYPPSDPS